MNLPLSAMAGKPLSIQQAMTLPAAAMRLMCLCSERTEPHERHPFAIARWKFVLAFGLWKRVTHWRARRRGQRTVRPA